MNSAISEDSRRRLREQLSQVLPAQIANDLAEHHIVVTYARGSLLFTQGSPADLVFWVLSGLVKVYCPMPDGDRTFVRLCGSGEPLGYVDCVDSNGRRSQAFEAQAVTKCTVALFTRDQITKVLEKLEKVTLIHLLEQLNTAWSSAACRSASFLGFSFRQRLEVTLKDLATRFGVEDQRGLLLPMKLSHANLAEMIAGSRPMVTRLIARMTGEHSLHCDGKQRIVPSDAVRNGAGKANGTKSMVAQLRGNSTRANGFSSAGATNGFGPLEHRH